MTAASVSAGPRLPVFLSDNHAESFGWIAGKFDLDRPHWLVLVDAHSDATSVEDSDGLRDGLRRVGSIAERAEKIGAWRDAGRVQAFGWIEPLMPRPVDRVLWVAGRELDEARRAGLEAEARDAIDGRLGFELRSSQSLADRWRVADVAAMEKLDPGRGPVVLSLDLDFFAGMDDAPACFERVWKAAMDWPGLCGVSVSVSRPWLAGGGECDELVRMLLDAVRRTRGAELELDATVDRRRDDSLQAGRLRAAGEVVPRWDAGRAAAPVRALLVAMRGRLVVRDRERDWGPVLTDWSDRHAPPGIALDGQVPGCDGVWRVAAGSAPVLRVRGPDGGGGRVRWFERRAVRDAYDLLPETGLGKEFSRRPGRWVYEGREVLGESGDGALAAEKWRAADRPPGRVLIEAEVERDGGWLPAGEIDLRLVADGGFRGGLSECFGMPYAFGIAAVRDGWAGGVDSGWGSDCSNFLVYAWRRAGVPLEWGDPGALRRQLECVGEGLTIGSRPAIGAGWVRDGLMVDFGRHVAAVWEDREPLGVLDGSDLLAHHLGGLAAVVTLAELAESRPSFALRIPRRLASCRLGFAGDVVLAGADAPGKDAIGGGSGGAGVVFANLEGVPSTALPERAARYDFRFDPGRIGELREAGIDVVSLANNHAADAGAAEIPAAVARLRKAGLGVVGAGEDLQAALRPWRGRCDGVELAVFGVCAVDAPAAGEGRAGVRCLPEHEVVLGREIAAAGARGEVVVVLVHWGEEYRREVGDEQRRWAAWMLRQGANVVAGSHPHVVQAVERQLGVVAYSLGNAVYPPALRGADDGATWQVEVDAGGQVLGERLEGIGR